MISVNETKEKIMKNSIKKLEEINESDNDTDYTPKKDLQEILENSAEDDENSSKKSNLKIPSTTKKNKISDPFLQTEPESYSKKFEPEPERVKKIPQNSKQKKSKISKISQIQKKSKNPEKSGKKLPFFLFQPDSNLSNSPRALLPQISPPKRYTLVLDLDETLVHFQEQKNGKNQFLIRPYAQYFLKEMSKWYEIVIFTAALKDYADFILDRLDTHGWISYRLYRRHTYLNRNVYQKDLSRLGRNLSKTLIVDNNAENFQLQPDNGIYIKSWYDDPEDKALFQLAPLLIGEFSISLYIEKKFFLIFL